jgi:mannan endo-1,4-beta-mannosidase
MIKARGAIFETDGKPLCVVGANCYFLGYCSSEVRMSILSSVQKIGGNAIRAWAFLDSAQPPSSYQPAFQYAAGGQIVFNDGPDGLERLDGLIADAESAGIYLILPLVNHWKDFGGAPLYLRWLGIPGPPDEFYRQRSARDAYRNWVQHLLTRVNTRTGRAYTEEPFILAWELANEPQCDHAGSAVLVDWVTEMSAFVKSLDPNHLVGVGDVGFFNKNGVNTEAFLRLPSIDMGTYHFYPESLGVPNDYGRHWIEAHLEAGRRVNKPMILEEYGARIDGEHVRQPEERDRWYARWLESVRLGCGGGDLVWMIGSDAPEVAGFRDDYTIYRFEELPCVADHALRVNYPVL